MPGATAIWHAWSQRQGDRDAGGDIALSRSRAHRPLRITVRCSGSGCLGKPARKQQPAVVGDDD